MIMSAATRSRSKMGSFCGYGALVRIGLIARSDGYSEFAHALAARLPGHALVRPDQGPLDAAFTAGGAVTRALLEREPIGFVQTIGTGFENVDLAAATELGVWVANLRSAATGNADSVAEHAVLLMLALARKLPIATERLRRGEWAQPTGTALLGKLACIVGLGDIGTAITLRLAPFGMRLVATRRDPARGGPPGVRVLAASALSEAVREADFVIVSARASAENRTLIDAKVIAAMKPGAFVINVARGSLVELDALQAALESGHLAGAGLDVFPQEPIDPAHPILRLPQVIATPHIAGVTDVNLARSIEKVADNFSRYIRGERPEFLLNEPPHPRKPLGESVGP
jgi:phosphoglycerate dehydrogenase-like enzyme